MQDPVVHAAKIEHGRAYYRANAEAFKEANATKYRRNRERYLAAVVAHQNKPEVKERRLAKMAEWYARKRETIRQQQAEYRRKNLAVFMARDARRRAAELRAKPVWVDEQAIQAVYEIAAQRTRETGIKHVVDHIVPLQGRNVSGLHVAWNLQVLTERENLRKSNKHVG